MVEVGALESWLSYVAVVADIKALRKWKSRIDVNGKIKV